MVHKRKIQSILPCYKKIMLCLSEKLHVLFSKEGLLSKGNKKISKCRHENKHKLSNDKIQINESKFPIETNE